MSVELKKRILSTIVLIPLVILLVFKGSIILNLFLIVCLAITIFEWSMMSKNKNYYYLGIVFLIFSFYTFYKINYDYNNSIIILFILFISVFTDIGGYVFGKLFKGPKLTSISPKKTYSGLIGAFFLPIFLTFLFLEVATINLEKFENFNNIYLFLILISAVSQIGDIIISYFKRLSNIKDTGKIIPGHGGLLDRIDGMIFAFPFSYLLLSTNFFLVI